MKLRSLLPLFAAVVLAGHGRAQTSDDSTPLLRDLRAVMQQRDALIDQAAQANRERDTLKGQLESLQAENATLRQKVAAEPPTASAPEQALKEAQMKADMTVRAFALKDEEAQRAIEAAAIAARKQAEAERSRETALAEARQLLAERDAARQSEATERTTRAQMQNELYAAQVRIDNLVRALAAHGGPVAQTPAPTSPTPVLLDEPKPAPAPVATVPAEPTTAAAASPRTHTVGEGETLSLIAFKYYGSPNKWDKVFNANRDKLKNPDQVRPGMILKVP